MPEGLDSRDGSPGVRRRRAASLLAALAILLAPSTALARPSLHYHGARVLPLAARQDPFQLRKQLYPALKAAGIGRIELVAGPASIVQKRSPTGMMYLDGLPAAALHAVLLVLPAEYLGAEIDLLVEGRGGPDDPDRLWTVRRDLGGGIVVLKGSPPPPLDGPDPAAEELSERFGIGALEDSPDASWSANERRVLARTLELLSREELALLGGTSFLRARSGAPGHAGFYRQSRLGEPGRITVFDAAFTGMPGGGRYVGPPERPVPFAAFAILHEIGHAIARAERRSLLLQRRESVEIYAASGQSLDSATRSYKREWVRRPDDVETAQRRRELEAELARRYVDLQAHYRAIAEIDVRLEQLRTGLASVERRYAALPEALEGPTPYGRSRAREGFAEAFALSKVDPESLRWISPAVHAWFASSAYLEREDRPLPEVASPAGSTEGR